MSWIWFLVPKDSRTIKLDLVVFVGRLTRRHDTKFQGVLGLRKRPSRISVCLKCGFWDIFMFWMCLRHVWKCRKHRRNKKSFPVQHLTFEPL